MSSSKLDTIYKNDKYLRVGFMDISSGNEKFPNNYDYKNFNVIIEAFWVNYPFCWVKNKERSSKGKQQNQDIYNNVDNCKPSTFALPCVYPLKDYKGSIEFYNSNGTKCNNSTDCESGICTAINCVTTDKNIYNYNHDNFLCRESANKCYDPSQIPSGPIEPSKDNQCSGTGFKLWRDWAWIDGCGNSCVNVNNDFFTDPTKQPYSDIKTNFPVLPTNRKRGGKLDEIIGYVKGTSSCLLDSDSMNRFMNDLNPDTLEFGGNANDAYVNFFNSMHVANPHNSNKLRDSVTKQNKIVLASIGGWGMGGSSNNKPLSGDDVGSIGYYNNWASCLKDIGTFVTTTQNIINLGYDGVDIDCETIFAGDMDDFDSTDKCISGDVKSCYSYLNNREISVSIDNTTNKLFNYFSKLYDIKNKIGIISTSPRVTDIIESIDDDGSNVKLGFMGLIFYNWDSSKGILFDMVNIQFYNDYQDYCLYYDDNTGEGQIGKKVIPILNYINKNWRGKVIKYIQIGILGKSGSGTCDQWKGSNINYCLTSEQIDSLYFKNNLTVLNKYEANIP